MKILGHIVDIPGKRVFDGEISSENGRIVSVTPMAAPEGSPFIMPGFIDSHVHIESSMLLPEYFAREAMRHGTVAAVCDPHEIANVLGMEGVRFMIENSGNVPFHFHFGAPSCVPCSDFETSGAVLGPAEIEELMADKDIHVLSEMMFAMGVVLGIPDVMAKIASAKAHCKVIDGHSPGLEGEELKKYVEAGVSTDHECYDLKGARERIALGMKILIREGSAAKNFESLAPLLAESGDMLMFCSDDKHPDDLVKGHINLLVKRAVAMGYPVWNVLNAACVTPVRHYGIDCGLLQPGDSADFILVDNLSDFNVLETWVRGEKAVYSEPAYSGRTPNNFHAEPVTSEDIRVAADEGASVRAIVASDGSLITGESIEPALIENGTAIADVSRDILKIVVYNRYAPGKPKTAFIKGFGLKKGAIASSVAHDSHNIVAVGASDAETVAAINAVIEMKGGIAAVDGNKLSTLPLPVAGLMAPGSAVELAQGYSKMQEAAKELGTPLASPFMTLSFMALPVIPDLKITDRGLFDARTFNFTTILTN